MLSTFSFVYFWLVIPKNLPFICFLITGIQFFIGCFLLFLLLVPTLILIKKVHWRFVYIISAFQRTNIWYCWFSLCIVVYSFINFCSFLHFNFSFLLLSWAHSVWQRICLFLLELGDFVFYILYPLY